MSLIILPGGAEATVFERITKGIAEWLICNPVTTWKDELLDASNMVHPQMYEY